MLLRVLGCSAQLASTRCCSGCLAQRRRCRTAGGLGTDRRRPTTARPAPGGRGTGEWSAVGDPLLVAPGVELGGARRTGRVGGAAVPRQRCSEPVALHWWAGGGDTAGPRRAASPPVQGLGRRDAACQRTGQL